jgi:hypothetical protein
MYLCIRATAFYDFDIRFLYRSDNVLFFDVLLDFGIIPKGRCGIMELLRQSANFMCFSIRFWNCSNSVVFWKCTDSGVLFCFSIRFWNCSNSVVFWDCSDSVACFVFSLLH